MVEQQTRDLPAHVTMPLLDLITRQSLDQDYAAAAARPQDGETTSPRDTRRSPRGRRTTMLALVVFGLLVCTAFVQTRSTEADRLATRASLIDRLTERRASDAALQDQIGRYQATVARLQQRLADVDEAATEAELRLQRLQTRTGFSAVTGPGVRIVVTDPVGGMPNDMVRDSDLALLVDGLWNAGAEAIAINDRRLTALTSIRNSSAAIHVGGQPLSPPYVVEAIGDVRTLQANLVNNARGARFFSLAQTLGFQVTRDNVDRLRLPGSRPQTLRYAHAVTASDAKAAGGGDRP